MYGFSCFVPRQEKTRQTRHLQSWSSRFVMSPEDRGGARRRQCFTALMAAFHLVILSQLVFALFVSRAVFIRTGEVEISLFAMCQGRSNGTMAIPHYPLGSGSKDFHNALTQMAVVSVFSPIVLLLFSAMAYLFAVVCLEPGLLQFSIFCLATSSALMFAGLAFFVAMYWPYVHVAWLSESFYCCAFTVMEMAMVAVLFWKSRESTMGGKTSFSAAQARERI